ncbi:MAG: glucose-6-phosphate dehydrogenase [Rhodoferax sp.]|nr:glucose-6-phosphate dehydrogenase [Rhodoferax sp.]
MSAAPTAPAATLVIFGITGDLCHRLLMPSLIHMTASKLIGDGVHVIGIGRSEGDDEWLRASFENFNAEAGGEGEEAGGDPRGERTAWKSLRPRISYLRGDMTDAETYKQLRQRFADEGTANAVFYLAMAPKFFGDAVEHLADAGLLDESAGFRRVAIEKPFGRDFLSARELNERILARATEGQIYRIDHFLGKETVQNVMTTRFANAMIEAVWNSHYIDHVQITSSETVDVGKRGGFFDANGTLRDMVPNHLFQLLAMVCMEPPNAFDAESVRNERSKVLEAVRGPDADEVAQDAVRGAYTAGEVAGRPVGDYLATPEVAAGSRTETYVALKLSVDTWRWAGVPFYLRTGKALSHRDTEIVVTFKTVPFTRFARLKHDGAATAARLPPNRLVIQLQPDEGLSIDFVAKRPGPVMDTAPVKLAFNYKDNFDLAHTTGYETLLYDILIGDQTLFQRADGIEAAWRAVQPVLDAWAAGGAPEPYTAGSAGPSAADDLMARDGRAWHRLGT